MWFDRTASAIARSRSAASSLDNIAIRIQQLAREALQYE
jgi:hypothetical protein